ncbi:MAG: IncP plasmid survival protein KfrC family protein [Methyloglobulus sp.]
MGIPNEQTQMLTKTRELDSTVQTNIEFEVQAESLLDEAREADAGQSILIDSATLESQYTAALATQVDAKHDQTERIEDRLENLIELQASRLQQVQVQQPGFLALPGTRQLWQQKLQQQQNTLQKLRGRLEAVREIKEGMGLHCPRIEELAAHKLRFKEPGMAADWVERQEAQRRHQALIRQQEQNQKKSYFIGESEQQGGRGLHRSLSTRP